MAAISPRQQRRLAAHCGGGNRIPRRPVRTYDTSPEPANERRPPDWNKIVGELLGIIRCLAWNAHTDGCTIDTAAAVQHVQDMLDGELARIEYDP